MKDSTMPDASSGDEPSDSTSSSSKSRSSDSLTLEGGGGAGGEADDETEAFLTTTVRTRDVEVKDSHHDYGFLSGRYLLTLAIASLSGLALGWFGLIPNKSFEVAAIDDSPSSNASSYVLFNQSKEYTNIIYKQRQIANYKRGGRALILSVHITHHAGTSVCIEMKKHGPAPEFACLGPGKNESAPWPEGLEHKYRPKGMDEMRDYVGRMRPYFHFVRLVLRTNQASERWISSPL